MLKDLVVKERIMIGLSLSEDDLEVVEVVLLSLVKIDLESPSLTLHEI